MKSAYERLSNSYISPPNGVFKQLWQSKAMLKVWTTAWRVLLDRIPTRSGLIRRGVLVNSTSCALCQAEDEIVQHLFIECPIGQRVWSLCFKWVGILFLQHKLLRELPLRRVEFKAELGLENYVGDNGETTMRTKKLYYF